MSARYGLSVCFVGMSMLLAGCSMGPLFIHEQRSPYDFDTTMDMALMSTLIGGSVGPVLAEIAAEDAAIIGFASVDR
jgi:hypothetical protein